MSPCIYEMKENQGKFFPNTLRFIQSQTPYCSTTFRSSSSSNLNSSCGYLKFNRNITMCNSSQAMMRLIIICSNVSYLVIYNFMIGETWLRGATRTCNQKHRNTTLNSAAYHHNWIEELFEALYVLLFHSK